jgi:hypothetical protein
MRRAPVLLVAVGYTLSFLVVCLGACLAPAPAGQHGCCQDGEGWRAPASDCCSVMPGLPHAAALALDAPPALAAAAGWTEAAPASLVPRGPVAASTPSPPLLVLRI